ncbi:MULTISPECIES: hypothetical protein [unclassified Nostoc]|uniref:hypothetical protein n=1 Tax=unclassified Nostoc TaxID=2593658 RepID=UPI002AD2B03D|nr:MULTISPECIES: hypothetical protein [unclassified Nostoc]MDZ8124842.1 hypothetical protein [Nostoc sp. CmiVER01]MDZ8223830.1 hypothetical protein [Nostoc sp. ChiVER01]
MRLDLTPVSVASVVVPNCTKVSLPLALIAIASSSVRSRISLDGDLHGTESIKNYLIDKNNIAPPSLLSAFQLCPSLLEQGQDLCPKPANY